MTHNKTDRIQKSDRELMEEIAMLFLGNQGCNFDETGNQSLLLLIKESIQDIMKRGVIQ